MTHKFRWKMLCFSKIQGTIICFSVGFLFVRNRLSRKKTWYMWQCCESGRMITSRKSGNTLGIDWISHAHCQNQDTETWYDSKLVHYIQEAKDPDQKLWHPTQKLGHPTWTPYPETWAPYPETWTHLNPIIHIFTFNS